MFMAEEMEIRAKRRREEVANSEAETETGEEEEVNTNTRSIIFDDGNGKVINNCIYLRENKDGNGIVHTMAKFPVIVGKNNRKTAGFVWFYH